MEEDITRNGEDNLTFRMPKDDQKHFQALCKRTKQKQNKFLSAIKSKQLIFFARQQNKFMKTTNEDGGVREDEASLKQISLSRSRLFDCFRGQ